MGLVVLGSRSGLHAGDFDFDAAVGGVFVFADAIGDIDAAAFDEGKFCGAKSHVPADGADGAASAGKRKRGAGSLREFETNVALFHEAHGCEETRVACNEDGFRVAVAEGLEFAEPSGKDGCDAVEG